MSQITACQKPDLRARIEGEYFALNQARKEYVDRKRIYSVDFEVTRRCAAGCSYCVTASDTSAASEISLTREKMLDVLDQAWEMGVRATIWEGGDPLLHPDFFDALEYTLQKGMSACVLTSGLFSKRDARRFVELNSPLLEAVGVHIDSIVQEVYNRVNHLPGTLQKKVDAYRGLLEAGFPPEKVLACLTLTEPMIDSIEETIDWFVDEMGARELCLLPYIPMGFCGQDHGRFEVSLSSVRRANELVAEKLGQEWLQIGGSPLGSLVCKTNLAIHANGDVRPCGGMPPEMKVGNVHQESLRELFEKNREAITFNGKIQGKCGECENNALCIGCRGRARQYLGDMWASDPKCWLNPEAKETYLR